MSLRSLEAAILKEARIETATPKLRQSDITEWRTGQGLGKLEDDERQFFLPELCVTIAVKKKALDKKPKA